MNVMPKSTSINGVTIWLEQLEFCLHRCKWEFPDQHIANCTLPSELFFNILIISIIWSYDMCKVTNLLNKAKFLISEDNSSWEPTMWLLWRTCIHTVFVVSRGPAYARHISKCVWRAVIVGASNTLSSA